MKKLNLKSIKDGKWKKSSTQLSNSEMNKLKGGIQGCLVYIDGVPQLETFHPDCDYPGTFIFT